MTESPGVFDVAVIGAGQMGKRHARAYQRITGVRLVAVVDRDLERAGALAEELECKAYADAQQLLANHPNLAGVSVAVPTAFHAPVAQHLIQRGIACLVEKPLAATSSQARALSDLAAASGVILHVGHTERFNPAVRAVAAMKILPRFIEVHRISPMTFRSLDVGVVMDMMIHDLDIVLMLVGSPLKQVEATGVAVLGAHEDVANARLTFESGCVANITASRLAMKTERRMRLFSEDAYVSFDYARRAGVVIRKSQNADMLQQVRQQLATGADLSTLDYSTLVQVDELTMDSGDPGSAPGSAPGNTRDDPLTAELRHFTETIRRRVHARGGREVPDRWEEFPGVPGGDAGVAAIEAAERVLDAIRGHRWQGFTGPRI